LKKAYVHISKSVNPGARGAMNMTITIPHVIVTAAAAAAAAATVVSLPARVTAQQQHQQQPRMIYYL
jgi:hypothetical protein